MSNRNQNMAVLNEARLVVAKFESTFGLTTAEMLASGPNDERIAQIDPFDLMDWHYALDQIRAVEQGVVTLDAQAAPAGPCPGAVFFSYRRQTFTEVAPTSDRELLLVA